MASALALLRRYVTDYVNRHDFGVIPDFMADDYTLYTGGITITGRDGPYRSAVNHQLQQFPGLVFTPHAIAWSGNRMAVRFTEHGASARHEGRRAACHSIGIYTVRDGRLASCALEQDYFSRRRQLADGAPITVDPPAIAPWDTPDQPGDEAAERVVKQWLESAAFMADEHVQIDDSHATGVVQRILITPTLEMLELLSAGDAVAFHAVQRGRLAGDFPVAAEVPAGQAVFMHMSGFVTVRDGAVRHGHIIRDRLGLHRRLVSRA